MNLLLEKFFKDIYHWKHVINRVTSKLNTTIKYLHDRIIAKTMKGSDNGFSKLDEVKVKKIKLRLKNRESGLKIAKDFGIHHTVIYKIKNNKAWTHVKI